MMHSIALCLWIAVTLAPAPAPPDCRCDKARRTHGWCSACEVGYVAGLPIRHAALHEAIDAHGHDLMISEVRCELCARAILDDGFCDEHDQGFLDGSAYHSRLGWELAQGQVLDPGTLDCQRCRQHVDSPGWCEEHRRGMVGNVTFTDRQRWSSAAGAFRQFTEAIELARRCELCAASMVIDGRCPEHRVRYIDGKPRAED